MYNVAIIGAGPAGIFSALEIVKLKPDWKVVLIEKGERTVEQGKVLNQELKHNAKQKVKEHVSVQVTKKYDKAFECVDEMSAEDLALLKERIAKAEALQKEKQEAEEDVEVEENEATTDSEASQVQEDETEQ